MLLIRKTLQQSFFLVAIAVVAGLAVNALRPDGLPLAGATPSAVTLPDESGEIAVKDALMLFASNRALFVDARSGFEFADGHIQGAVSVPVDDFEAIFPKLADRFEKVDAVITYCDGERCPLSTDLAKLLADHGVKNVFVLKNGWTVWNNERLPVEKGQQLESLLGVRDNLCVECTK
ncbi:MAG: rhodanese-like domain-containing protein [Desulfovibrio sp.]|nr:rhodanese-like domain-containing protein [Desulfovibrio sp.]